MHVVNWAGIAGSWSFGERQARYEGPSKGEGAPYGLALSDVQLRDGTVRARIALSVLEDTTGGIVLGFQSGSAPYIIVQLGSSEFAYALAVFDLAVGWRALTAVGSIANLQADRPYAVEVAQQGQRISLAVNGVRIFDEILPSPLPGNQVGLFGWGKAPVLFQEVTVRSERPRAFVAMPFSEPFETMYREVIKPEAERLGFDVVRIDDIARPGIIFEDIKREIAEAKAVIAEITAPNQNVFYELGYAHALNKPTVLLARRGVEPLPFDIRSYRVIFYDDSIAGKPLVERNLAKHLNAILREG